MPLPDNFTKSPYEILDPDNRWYPSNADLLRDGTKLLPPLVHKIRLQVKEWRNNNYNGASETSKALLDWWFQQEHDIFDETKLFYQFNYYFAQREAIESIIYLYEVAEARSKHDLLRYDSSDSVKENMFYEDWLRFVIKMATGSGKTKVMSLLIAWSYFHKFYETNSTLSRNFLLIAPNIIVLDRLKTDFQDKEIFENDPVIPDNGFAEKNWHDDFKMDVHIQKQARLNRKTGNIFLTNVHHIYTSTEKILTADDDDSSDYFLGPKPVAKTTDSTINLLDIIRDIDEVMIINDEAHHIHNDKLAWFKSIQDISYKMRQKDKLMPLQVDFTATPKHNKGNIFVQTIADYPLVEAIHQNVTKKPTIPDDASRQKLREQASADFTEKYADYINLGVVEWKKTFEQNQKSGKKSILFIMTDDTTNCDDVALYLKKKYSPDFEDAVLVIHTNKQGEIEEKAKAKQEELQKLRDAANNIDKGSSPYKAVVSVLMLKEGWDVQNVTTIVGLRPFKAKSNILPEQTLGRGLRRMFRKNDEAEELVSVIGTDAFIEFVKSIEKEGVTLEEKPMGDDTGINGPILIEIDKDNPKKNIDTLDIEIPILTPRIYREFQNLDLLDPASFDNEKYPIKPPSDDDRSIAFSDIIEGKFTHETELPENIAFQSWDSAIAFFAYKIADDMRVVSGFPVLYGKIKEFITYHLFETEVNLEDENVVKNLSEADVKKIIIDTFKLKINKLTVQDKGTSIFQEFRKISETKPFRVNDQDSYTPEKSLFNKIVGDKSRFELEFASFLDSRSDIIAFAKNYRAANFRIEYQDTEGKIRNYHPDFLVKKSDTEIFIIETKGRADLNDVKKFKRLQQWCEDANEAQDTATFKALYVQQGKFEEYRDDIKSFATLIKLFENATPDSAAFNLSN